MAPKRKDILICDASDGKGCGLMVEVLVDCGCSNCDLICCGKPMKPVKENSTDGAKEKHVPMIEKIAGGYKVKVGSVPHPMVSDHWIAWIELIADSKVCREYLKPGQAPEATFMIDAKSVLAREFCNKHGVWKS